MLHQHVRSGEGISVCLVDYLFLFQDIPQQMNGSDCGMFACKFAEYVTRDARITFSQVTDTDM